MAQKGYNFVNGQLVQVDQNPFNYGGGSMAQVYMTDEERSGRDWSNAIAPTTGASSGGSSTPAPTKPRTVTSVSGPGADKSTWGKVPTLYLSDGTSMSYNDYYATQTTPTVKGWQDLVGAEIGGGAPSAPAAAPTIIDRPVQPTATQQTAPVIQPTTPIKTNPAVQAAAEEEKKAIQDTYSRTDTILSGSQDLYGGTAANDDTIYRVRAGYRRKSKLGA